MRYLPALSILLTLVVLSSAAPAAERLSPELTEGDLQAFLDEFFERELAPQQVVGAGVVVVRDGRVLAARGYGYADLEEQRPVVAESTIFPAQSVSKLFAATAVMQVYERGLVDLHADVREYLGEVTLDTGFAEPLTLAHLLTHTSGFDDSYLGFLPRGPEDTLTVPDFLNRYRRRVIFRPGTVHAYTNYGSLMARHVVNRVTGRSYEDFLREEILDRLGMEQSCALPAPPEWASRFATGYLPAGDGFESTRRAFPDGQVRFRTSTGTVGSTVVDMARFMIAHLEGGSFEGARILEPATVELMHARQFAQHPRLPGATYGFFESAGAGERGIFHFGSGFGYGTFLYLLPEHRTGIYIAHSNSASRLAEAFLNAFLERYFERPQPVVSGTAERFEADASHFAGFYVPVRRAETTFEKLPLMLFQAHIRASDPRTLANDQILPREWLRTGRLTFERASGDGILAFQENAAGRPTLASIWDEEAPQLLVLERVPWYRSAPILMTQMGWFALVFLAVVLGYPLGAWVRRRRAKSGAGALTARTLKGSTVGAAALNLAFLAGLVWIFASNQWFYGVSAAMVAIFCLPLAALALTGISLSAAIRGRAAASGRWPARLARLVILGTLVLFPIFLARWNLLGFYF